MTASTRELHITKALDEQRNRPGGGEATTLFFRGKRELLPVIELPLTVPILNARSFRIAPLLEDHAKRDRVEQDPESDEAQGVVAELVRRAHRHKEGLKESLHVDGQDQPGVITRSGKLINGNSRCVLLRELVHDGTIPSSTVIRVAVLPSDTSNREELDLESTLQQQKDFKDEYNLVSRLMMLQRLSDSGMSDQAIAAQQRTKGGAKRVKELREILVLMGRARLLPTEHLPLSAFVKEEDQQENWLALRSKVLEIEGLSTRDAADSYLREWLVAYFTGHDSVHQLRNATEGWTRRDMLPHLSEAGADGERLHELVTAKDEASATDPAAAAAEPEGLDLLAVNAEDAPAASVIAPTQRLLDLATQSSQDSAREFTFQDGTKRTGQELQKILHKTASEGLSDAAQRKKDANRLTRPQSEADGAARSLRGLIEALEDVIDDSEFVPKTDDLRTTLDLIQSRLDEAIELVGSVPKHSDEGDSEE
ncbi:hypothetical protein [Microbacterium sp. 18062]|uniref:hypothetical protein n=1 Tax=Microbacterium sp. 18062 TaxID=2681410 RepID=UPI00135ACC40|nr:hypothetical protein [Microbacterium sp. 18062]